MNICVRSQRQQQQNKQSYRIFLVISMHGHIISIYGKQLTSSTTHNQSISYRNLYRNTKQQKKYCVSVGEVHIDMRLHINSPSVSS